MPTGEPGHFLGLPIWVWVVGVAAILVIYFLFFRGSSNVPPTTGGGGGTATENVRLNKGAVNVTINADGTADTDQPKPPVHHRRKHEHAHQPPTPPPRHIRHRRKTWPEPPKRKK